ncbi:MAG: hypothetical protein EVJ46_04080 [Candidatus Acididesulfobacter guangdongensis]|uniref:Uncharacterized protein n=1 Tax=Acididesulfobacter guangdongensis TaxID=2597225 RepID=A0A519BJG9_ACIG2|nr:MAG: hypothetical protein EVJ46_04080 [Candidatus Acididesulfobacter guangdongensis]
MRYKIIYDIDRDESIILDEELRASAFTKGLPEQENGELFLISKDIEPKIFDFNNKSLLKKYTKSSGIQVLYFNRGNRYYIYEVPDISVYCQKNVTLYSYIVNKNLNINSESVLIENYENKIRIFDGKNILDVDENLTLPFINQMLTEGRTHLYSNTEKFKNLFNTFRKIDLFDILSCDNQDYIISKKKFNKEKFKFDFLLTKIFAVLFISLVLSFVYLNYMTNNLKIVYDGKHQTLLKLETISSENNRILYLKLLKRINIYKKIKQLYIVKPLDCHILNLNISEINDGYNVNFNFHIENNPLNFENILSDFKKNYEKKYAAPIYFTYKIQQNKIIFAATSKWLISRLKI